MNEEATSSAERLRFLTDAMVKTLTPQERDRTMQIHLAQARGPVRNAMLLCDMTAMLLRARQTAQETEREECR